MKKVMFCAATAVLAAVVCFAPAQADEAKGAKHGAAIGAEAPNFTLTDTDGTSHTLADLKGKVVVLEWFNPTCPYVVKHHEKNPTMKTLYAKYKDQNVVWMAINSGAEGKPGSSAEENVAPWIPSRPVRPPSAMIRSPARARMSPLKLPAVSRPPWPSWA